MVIINSNQTTNLSNTSFDKSPLEVVTIESLVSSRDNFLEVLKSKGSEHDDTIRLKDEYISLRERFIIQNENFIKSTVHKLHLFPKNANLKEDIFQQSRLAFINAINNYSPEKSDNFRSYAMSAIKNSIVRFLSDMSKPLHIPARSFPALPVLTEAYHKLKLQLGREPLEEEVFNEAKKVSGKSFPKKLHFIYPLVLKNFISLYEPPFDYSNLMIADILQAKPEASPEQTELEELLKKRLNLILSNFDERNREIVKCYYGIDTDKEYFSLGSKE